MDHARKDSARKKDSEGKERRNRKEEKDGCFFFLLCAGAVPELGSTRETDYNPRKLSVSLSGRKADDVEPLLAPPDFLAVLRASGLLSTEVVDGLTAADPAHSARRIAGLDELVERGLLTGYQAQELLAGRGQALILDRYRILDCLAVGGMGQVYKAEHLLMKRRVALKIIARSPPAASSTGSRESTQDVEIFQREVQTVAQLCHPHIITAFDAGEVGGVRFLVMEYVDGIDLDRLVREGGRLPVGLSCEYVRQAALGLHYAFERGVLHRDVKPANLFLATRGIVDVGPASSRPTPGRLEAGPTQTTTGVVKLLDLGLARATAARGDEDGAAILSGTPDYMAPEVAHDSRSRDVRSDLYSLGCTFFYLLTGQVPFPGGTWTEKLLRHQYEAPPALRTLVPEVPPAVAAIVERLMAKDPADRYPTPGHLAAVLQEWLVRPGPAADARSPRTPTVSAATPLPGVLPDLSSALAATQPQTGTVTSQQKEPAGTARNRWQRQFLSWLLMIFLGVLTGLFAARTARQGPLHASNHAEDSLPAASTVDPFVLERSGTTYRSLTEAVAAAAEGDTIAIHGDDPLSAEVLDIHGKAMILRAARRRIPAWISVSRRRGGRP